VVSRARFQTNDPAIAKLLASFDAVNEKRALASIAKELDASFTRYAKLVKQPITEIKFRWAGGDVASWVPVEVMGSVYAGKQRALDSQGGFTPLPLPLLFDAAEKDEELGDHPAFDDLRAMFVERSLELAKLAIAAAVKRPAFTAMRRAEGFRITAVPGHDEPPIVLVTL
jgi:hypothetical protein